jgi:hypothetical protein
LDDLPNFRILFKAFAATNSLVDVLLAAPAAGDDAAISRDVKLKGYLVMSVAHTSFLHDVEAAATCWAAMDFLEGRYQVNSGVLLAKLEAEWASMAKLQEEEGMPPELAPCVQQIFTQPSMLGDVEQVRLALMAAEATMPKDLTAFYGNQGKPKSKGKSCAAGGSGGCAVSGSAGGADPERLNRVLVERQRAMLGEAGRAGWTVL